MATTRSQYTILLADDHALIRHGIRNLISNNPALKVVGEVSDGEELLEFLKTTQPELLILDISMPKLTGIEAVSRVKKLYPDIKILMLTMHKNKQYFYHAMSAGADGYLMKEDSDEELLLAIKRVQDGKSYLSPFLSQDFADDVISAYRNNKSSPFETLTSREREVLNLVVEGHTSKVMATMLCLSPRTIDHHRANLLRKFDMKNSVDLVNFAVRNGFVTPGD
ncbi:CheY-like receiver and HTH DNA-binding domain-containing response regulator [Desulfocapsa sulfexigens DSM 10523]|uniref:CheY-like receiver and HTH DNA-binding domain-containing response regulator n=1 Tax=Desulfocapsa sulfexigens (strain DSM 10523 / SB164P1) TaxID=1167006 RepID=M1P9E5_DESSD|nr:response regulator transcription factor [Desulfocapsa sulfexigens]AGF78282.1 CheY-like receiver and HTH DNA-binding domain-containing response regulator [Desulfocapsa sulfexigens DSM 10523]